MSLIWSWQVAWYDLIIQNAEILHSTSKNFSKTLFSFERNSKANNAAPISMILNGSLCFIRLNQYKKRGKFLYLALFQVPQVCFPGIQLMLGDGEELWLWGWIYLWVIIYPLVLYTEFWLSLFQTKVFPFTTWRCW